jgi:putative flavoprotein involved in K+ transport
MEVNYLKGKKIHSSQYKNVEDFKNQDVVVVGGGNSAVQIAMNNQNDYCG